jgi:hypothetical protein
MVIKYISTFSIPRPSKHTRIGIFWYENKPSVQPCETPVQSAKMSGANFGRFAVARPFVHRLSTTKPQLNKIVASVRLNKSTKCQSMIWCAAKLSGPGANPTTIEFAATTPAL